MDKITPFVWYAGNAEEAAAFYVSIFPDSHIDRVTVMPGDSPSGPAGSVRVVQFTLSGRSFVAMTAGGAEPFNHAVSLSIDCVDQAEVDRYWDALLASGGTPVQCGWLKDRYGLSWQVVPRAMTAMMASPDRVKAKRATEAMMKMIKLDVAALQKAFDGD